MTPIRNPDDPSLPTNSPRTHYALSDEALTVIRSYGSDGFSEKAEAFRDASEGGLAAVYAQARDRERVNVTLPSGEALSLSPGKHNQLQRDLIEIFLPQFAPGSVVLYLGDTDTDMTTAVGAGMYAVGALWGFRDKAELVTAGARTTLTHPTELLGLFE